MPGVKFLPLVLKYIVRHRGRAAYSGRGRHRNVPFLFRSGNATGRPGGNRPQRK